MNFSEEPAVYVFMVYLLKISLKSLWLFRFSEVMAGVIIRDIFILLVSIYKHFPSSLDIQCVPGGKVNILGGHSIGLGHAVA
jgi:hypothetical protein